MAALAPAAAFAGLLLALVPVVGADTDAAGGNAAPCLGFLVGIRCVSDVWCALGSCSCGSWGPLHLLEQPGSARRLVGGRRRRPLRRSLDGRLLLGLRHHLNVRVSLLS